MTKPEESASPFPAVGAPGAIPNTLVLQSATTIRFALFVIAMLSTGLFIGVSVFGAVHGAEFAAQGAACLNTGPGFSLGTANQAASTSDCLAPLEMQYAGYAAGGSVLVALGSLLVIAIAPWVIVRRRSLRPLGPALQLAGSQVLNLCAEIGLHRPPRLMVGPSRQRDAFCFGLPGRYMIALPPALAIRPSTKLFDAVIRHELAHIRHHDVTFAWLARSAWYVLTPLLLLPVGLFLVTGDSDIIAGYLWRAAIFALVIELAARSALRAREHHADIEAATPTGPAAFQSVLAAARGPVAGWRRAVAVHPSTAARISVVNMPGSVAAVNPADGAVVAFLIALVLPTFDRLFTGVFVTNTQDLGLLVSALLLGPLAGMTLGVGLWRQALVRRVAVVPGHLAWVIGAVAAGAVAGQLSSFAGVGLGISDGMDHPAVVVILAGALTGATLLTAGAGEIWAQAPLRFGGRAGYIIAAVVVSTVLNVLALWVGDVVKGILDLAGWAYATVSLIEEVATPPVVAAMLVPAAAIAWRLTRRRSRSRYPGWLTNQSMSAAPPEIRLRHVLVAATTAGLTGTGVIIGYRITIGDSPDPLETIQRFHAYWWMAAATGAAAALALATTGGRQGWGAGLLAGPLASTIAAAGNLVMLAVINGHLPAEKITETLTKELALGWVLTVAVAALPLTFAVARPPSITVLVLTALLTSSAATAAIALMRDTVLPPVMALAAADPDQDPSAMAPNPVPDDRIRPPVMTE